MKPEKKLGSLSVKYGNGAEWNLSLGGYSDIETLFCQGDHKRRQHKPFGDGSRRAVIVVHKTVNAVLWRIEYSFSKSIRVDFDHGTVGSDIEALEGVKC